MSFNVVHYPSTTLFPSTSIFPDILVELEGIAEDSLTLTAIASDGLSLLSSTSDALTLSPISVNVP